MQRYVGIAPEPTFKPSTLEQVTHFIEPSSVSIDTPDSPFAFTAVANLREPRLAIPSTYIPTGSVEYSVDLDSIGSWLRGALGQYISIGTDASGASDALDGAGAARDITITLDDASAFASDDYIQIGATVADNPEIAQIASVSSNIVTLAHVLLRDHADGDSVLKVTSPFLHRFTRTLARNLPSFTYYVGRELFEHRFKGVTINRLSITQERDLLTSSIEILAAEESQAGINNFAKAFSSDVVGNRHVSLFHLENPSRALMVDAESFSIDINNNIDEASGIRFGSRFPQEFEVTGFEVSGSFRLAFKSLQHYQDFWGNDVGPTEDASYSNELTAEWSRNGKRLKVSVPEMLLTRVASPLSGRDRLTQEISFRALASPAAGSPVVVDLANNELRY